jgi:hypothetical protein
MRSDRVVHLSRGRIALEVAICGIAAALLTLGLGSLGDAEFDAVLRDALGVGIVAALFYAVVVWRVRKRAART